MAATRFGARASMYVLRLPQPEHVCQFQGFEFITQSLNTFVFCDFRRERHSLHQIRAGFRMLRTGDRKSRSTIQYQRISAQISIIFLNSCSWYLMAWFFEDWGTYACLIRNQDVGDTSPITQLFGNWAHQNRCVQSDPVSNFPFRVDAAFDVLDAMQLFNSNQSGISVRYFLSAILDSFNWNLTFVSLIINILNNRICRNDFSFLYQRNSKRNSQHIQKPSDFCNSRHSLNIRHLVNPLREWGSMRLGHVHDSVSYEWWGWRAMLSGVNPR